MAVLALYALAWGQPTADGLLLGFVFACAGESLRLWAVGYAGEPTRGERLEAPILVTAGPYALVRNPLYLGNLLNACGVCLGAFFPHQVATLLGLLALVGWFYRFLAAHEEAFLSRLFGTEYDDYRRRVPAWWPRRRQFQVAEQGCGSFCWRRSLRHERTTLFWWALVWLVLLVKGWFS